MFQSRLRLFRLLDFSTTDYGYVVCQLSLTLFSGGDRGTITFERVQGLYRVVRIVIFSR